MPGIWEGLMSSVEHFNKIIIGKLIRVASIFVNVIMKNKGHFLVKVTFPVFQNTIQCSQSI